MEIIFLGTSSGRPTKNRNLSAIALKQKESKSWCLIDCGEGTQYRVLNSDLNPHKLEVILITHVHGDHIFGLPGLLATLSMETRKEPLTIIAPEEVKTFILQSIKSSESHLTYEIKFLPIENLNKEYIFNEIKINAVELKHSVKSYGFVFRRKIIRKKLITEKLIQDGVIQGPLWTKIYNEEIIELEDKRIINGKDYVTKEEINKKIIICIDNSDPWLLKNVIEDTNVLVHESTFTSNIDKELLEYSGHCSAKNIAMFAEENKLPNLILTHFSSRYADDIHTAKRTSINDIHNEVKKYYKGSCYLANDYDNFVLSDSYEFQKIK